MKHLYLIVSWKFGHYKFLTNGKILFHYSIFMKFCIKIFYLNVGWKFRQNVEKKIAYGGPFLSSPKYSKSLKSSSPASPLRKFENLIYCPILEKFPIKNHCLNWKFWQNWKKFQSPLTTVKSLFIIVFFL